MGFPGGLESACHVGDKSSIPRSGRSLEKGIVIHSSILAWKIPWTENPGGLQSMGLQELVRTERLTLSLCFHLEIVFRLSRAVVHSS